MIKHRLDSLPLPHKLALITALCSLLTGLVLSLATVQGNHTLARQSLNLLGENLSTQLADSSTTSLVEGDKLSLLAQLEQVMENPLVAGVTIYDVANQPIVEAGDNQAGSGFSAAVTYHDSIAGYVLVTLDGSPLNRHANAMGWQLAGLSLLLTGLCYLLILPLGRWLENLADNMGSIVRASNYPDNTLGLTSPYQGQDALGRLVQRILKGPAKASPREQTGLAIMQLAVKEGEQEALEDFYPALKKISKLYDGELSISDSHTLSVAFEQQNKEDNYPFRALCCGYLVSALSESWLSSPTISLGFSEQAGGLFARQRLNEEATKASAGELAAPATLFEHSSVQGRCQYHEREPDAAYFECFNSPYDAMLERQLSTLRQQLANHTV